MANAEQNHWFWLGRRSIIRRQLSKLSSRSLAILELGSGTGGNVEMLREYGELTAIEMEPIAREISKKRHSDQSIHDGYLPNNIDVSDASHDVVCLFDVLEHIEGSSEAMKKVGKLVKPGGRVIITVPAYQWMWSEWDELHHHKRRYSSQLLRQEIVQAGLTADKLSHFNMFLFPIVALARFLFRILGIKGETGHGIPVRPINLFLANVLRFEGFLIDRFSLPFGVSILAVASKP